MTWLILGLILLVLIGIYLLPNRLEARRQPIDRAFRGNAPGKFVELSAGVTHYRWTGSTRGPVAVLIHGLTTGSGMWEETAEVLSDLGYRILMYDLYNRGFSDSVDGDHDIQLYLTQLDELLENQGLSDSLTVVGYSMGAIVATEFAASEPRLRRQINEDRAANQKAYVLKARSAELDRQGYLSGVLACRRGIMQHRQERQHRAITRDAIPTVAIWGEDDRVVPIGAVGKLAEWNRRSLHEVISEAGHEFPYSHVEEMNRKLRRVLRESD